MAARLRIPRALGKRRWAIVLALVVLVGIGGSAAWAATRSKASADTGTTTTATVSASTVSQSVSTTGTIEPAQQADLTFDVSGTVTSVRVAVGDRVKRGQALATVGTSELKSALTLAQATLTAAEESLTSAESGSSSLQIASAKAQVAQAKSNLAGAKADLADGVLRSTIAGTVATVNLSPGDTVGSSSSASGSGDGSAVDSSSSADIVVISTSAWIVNASVGSADLASVRRGLQAQVTPTDATTRVFGTVKSVGIVASSDSTSSSATFPVVIAVTGNPAGMYAGASASVSIIVKQVSDVLTVPTRALHSSGGQTYVLVVKNGKQVRTSVTIGTTYGPSTQVTKGLASGDQVAVTTTTGTRPGGTGTGRNGTNQNGFGGGGFGGNFGGGAPPAGGLPPGANG